MVSYTCKAFVNCKVDTDEVIKKGREIPRNIFTALNDMPPNNTAKAKAKNTRTQEKKIKTPFYKLRPRISFFRKNGKKLKLYLLYIILM